MPLEGGLSAVGRSSKLLLRHFLSSGDGGGGGRREVALAVSGEGGVDLGAVGRALGLDPATVRLNGHFLSRGPDHVSVVTWDYLLAFFSARGFAAGDSDRDPIAVQGKPRATDPGLLFPSDLNDNDHLSFKRKVRLEDGSPLKKKRVTEGSGKVVPEVGDGQLSDDDSLCIKRRLKLEDSRSSKKRKNTQSDSGSIDEASKLPIVAPKIGFTHSCNNGNEKRWREEEMLTTVSCKRVR